MTTFAILATGPSMSEAVAESVRGRCGAVAVSDAYRLAPWADALVSQDRAWWDYHAEAKSFAGRRFAGYSEIEGVEKVEFAGALSTGTNSGLLACHVAVRYFGATRLLLLGIHLGGSHFFGPHPEPLKNTTAARFEVMKRQFAQWRPKGIEVLNCTPGSALDCYPKMDLACALG